ncbi:DoxX family protein [Breoghania sp. L-A4]|uniref:DoxX family protein n=1 Tax=Breoghania sp. L-A4 TaxID=2304600 RepID=UPI000E35EA12|nr:DoxX family protein [Breoghania sp. L-A4]AXS41867.1 DoxX family protein [Breoghania sp. L-A4]
MGRITEFLIMLHAAVFGLVTRLASGWFLGLAARLMFSSVLLFYFWKSAATKVGSGALGFLSPSDGAYAQILPTVLEQAGYDTSQIAFLPYGLIVLLGTWAEFVLPLMILLGLFTRIASLSMMGFIAVMTYVDITGHHVEAQTIGAFFDAVQDSAISDQRLLWVFPLLYLVVRGPGRVSADWLLMRAYHHL